MELARSIGGTRSIGGSGDDIDASISVTLWAEYEIAREILLIVRLSESTRTAADANYTDHTISHLYYQFFGFFPPFLARIPRATDGRYARYRQYICHQYPRLRPTESHSSAQWS